jgi:hypothetical protein
MVEGISTVLKFLLFLVLIPVVVTVTVVFSGALGALPGGLDTMFLWGIGAFVILHLFVLEVGGMHKAGQKFIGDLFAFSAPLAEVLPLLVPGYAVLSLTAYAVTDLIWESKDLGRCFILLTGFFLSLHFVFTARALRESDAGRNPINYYFYMTLIYVFNVLVTALAFDGLFKGFSFPDLVERINAETLETYRLVLRQLNVWR